MNQINIPPIITPICHPARVYSVCSYCLKTEKKKLGLGLSLISTANFVRLSPTFKLNPNTLGEWIRILSRLYGDQ